MKRPTKKRIWHRKRRSANKGKSGRKVSSDPEKEEVCVGVQVEVMEKAQVRWKW